MPEQEPGRPDPSRPLPAAQRPAQARAGASEPTLLVVDGTGLLVRCSMAAKRQGLHSSDGTPTGALLMFINTLAAKMRAVKPRDVIVCWDGPRARDWRREFYPAYKANRPTLDDRSRDLGRVEVHQAFDFVEAAGFGQVVVPAFEADDIMAAVWRAAQQIRPRPYLVLCTEDKDLLQLLDSHTAMLAFSTTKVTEAADVIREWGIDDPRYLPWVRALAGDKSDNIPGLPRIGEKRAAQLVHSSMYSWQLIGASADDLNMAYGWRVIMDLREPPRCPEDAPGWSAGDINALIRQEWDPRHSVHLRELHLLLDKYELRVIRKRLDEGRLW